MPGGGARPLRFAVPLGLGLLCLFAYWPGLTSPLTHYDDSLYIYANVPIRMPGLAGFLAQWDSSRAWAGDYVEYFPLRDSVYWLLYQGWGLEPLPYHLVGLLAHLLATLAAWRLALHLGLSSWASAFAAGLFAVHPVHIESVVWAAGLKDPMYTAMMFASLVAYARYRDSKAPGWYALSLLWLSGAMLVKSMAMVVPVLMVAMERLVGTPTPWREVAKRVAGPAIFIGLWVAELILIGKASNNIVLPHGGTWASHAVLAAWAQVLYLQQSLIPYNVRFIYCFEPPAGLLDWRLGVALLAAVAVAALVVRWRRAPLRRFAIIWYLACLVPVSNLIPFPTVMQDRYLYAAVFGVAILAAGGLERLDPRLRRVLAPASLLLLGAVTAARASLWQDEAQLWAEPDLDPVCMRDRSFPAAQTHLLHFFAARDPETRLAAFERLVASPGFNARPEEEVCPALVSAIHLAVKEHVNERAGGWAVIALERCPGDPATLKALATLYLHHKPRRAVAYADRAFRLNPSSSIRALRGVAHLEAGDPQARELILEAVLDDPSYACPVVKQFNSEVGQPLQDKLVDILEHCPP